MQGKDNTPIFIIDFEATDNTENAQATQLGIEQVFFENNELKSTFFHLEGNDGCAKFFNCKPDVPISYGAMAVTGICDEDVAGSKSHKEVVPSILNYKQMYLIGHNVDYDIKVAQNAGVDVSGVKAIDTLALARGLYQGLDSYSLGALLYRFHYQHARKYAQKAHNAGYDVGFCYLILKKICTDFDVTSVEQLYALSEYHRVPKVMPFGKHRGLALEDLPLDYVQWMLSKMDNLDKYLRKGLEKAHNL